MHLFSQWYKTPKNYAGNHGDIVALAIDWLNIQGGAGDRPYDSNAGRTSLAGWLEEVKAPYPQGFEIHGDLFDVWSENYQPSVPFSDFARRTQSPTPRIACKALRRLQHYFGRSPVPEAPVMDLATMLQIAALRAAGEHELVEQTIAEHKRLHQPPQNEEKNDDWVYLCQSLIYDLNSWSSKSFKIIDFRR